MESRHPGSPLEAGGRLSRRPGPLIAGGTQERDDLIGGDGAQREVGRRLQQLRSGSLTHLAQQVKGPVVGGLLALAWRLGDPTQLPDQGRHLLPVPPAPPAGAAGTPARPIGASGGASQLPLQEPFDWASSTPLPLTIPPQEERAAIPAPVYEPIHRSVSSRIV